MAIWPFNRNKNEDSTLPEEVQNYYQAEKRERTGVAGLLAVGTLVATVLLAMGLFFGGRWVYRTVFDNNDEPTTAQNDGEQQEVDTNNEENPTTPSANPAPAPTPTPNPTPQPTQTSQTPTTPTTGPDLPRTGPEEDL